MAAWRLPGAPRHGIGWATVADDDDAEVVPSGPGFDDKRLQELLPDNAWQQEALRKRRLEEGEGERRRKGVCIRADAGGCGGLYGSSVGDGGLYGSSLYGNADSCAGVGGLYAGHVATIAHRSGVNSDPYILEEDEDDVDEPEPIRQHQHQPQVSPEPDVIVWPSFRGEEEFDWEAASPMPSPDSSLPSGSPPSGGPDDSNPVARGQERTPGVFRAEVMRILACAPTNHRGILGLEPGEWGDVQTIQKRYRQLMRLLHPDKRRPDDVASVGGKQKCDEAVELVQAALAASKKAAQDDPRLQAQHSNAIRLQEIQRQQAQQAMMRQQQQQQQSAHHRCTDEPVAISASAAILRLQEMHRQQARQAMERQQRQQEQSQASPPDVSALLASLSRLSPPPAAGSAAPMAGTTSAQIMGLLAGLRSQ